MIENPFPGRLVETGTHTAYLESSGECKPTVVLVSGLGANGLAWRRVQPEIAQHTRVVSYDRAGLGSSVPTDTPRVPANIAEELHALLVAAEISPPYILVGHSMGGVHSRAFIHQYRDEVAGLVLVDSSHEQQLDRLPRYLTDYDQRAFETKMQPLLAAAPEQLPALYHRQPPAVLPPEVYDLDAARTQPHNIMTIVRERDAYAHSSGADAPTPLGDLPLIVLTNVTPSPVASEAFNRDWGAIWQMLQAELAGLSTRAEHRNVEGSHFLHIDNPAAVIAAILDMLHLVRRADRL